MAISLLSSYLIFGFYFDIVQCVFEKDYIFNLAKHKLWYTTFILHVLSVNQDGAFFSFEINN